MGAKGECAKLFRRTIPDTSLKWIDFEADGKQHFLLCLGTQSAKGLVRFGWRAQNTQK